MFFAFSLVFSFINVIFFTNVKQLIHHKNMKFCLILTIKNDSDIFLQLETMLPYIMHIHISSYIVGTLLWIEIEKEIAPSRLFHGTRRQLELVY